MNFGHTARAVLGDGKALAPIFGKKKPRQALLTHPNNSQPKTAQSGGGMSCSTSNISMYKNHPGQNCSVQQSHMNGNQFNSSRRQPQQQFNSSRRQPQQQQQAQNQLQQHQLNNQAGIYKAVYKVQCHLSQQTSPG
ncbi:hypothetical protein LSAT2_009792 [Lamellibrachia satsuma]|nr:hypothetical protein LSAT2_009792 [Lamellibrachia satsuma]